MESLELNANREEPMRTMPSLLLSADVELSSEFLTRKFSRPQRQPEEVAYELTKDAGYLHQYYRLREDMFIHVWGLENFTGKKDEFDDNSDIMIARIGNHVIGGCRLTFSTPKTRKSTPMEKQDFDLAHGLPELNLSKESYVEISRMAILPEYQNSVVMLELSRQLLKRGAEQKARFAFTLAPAKLARNYRKAASLFGLEWQILNDVKIPEREEYEGIKMVLSMLDMAPVYRRKRKGAVASDSFTTA
jgi:hypothetical protein